MSGLFPGERRALGIRKDVINPETIRYRKSNMA
jgi:hypothetical protein